MTSSQQVRAGLFGFAVETSARRRAVVEMAPWRLRVFTRGGSSAEVGLSDSKRLIQTVSEALGSRAGAMTKVEEVRAAIEYERQRLVARVPREVSLVQERVLTETDQGSGLHTSDAFYARRFLVSDVIRFRAAAVAVGCFEALSREKLPADAGETARLDLAEDWPALFSPDGRAYKSLRRTLMNLPDGVPGAALLALPSVRLPRPITHPVELLALAAVAGERRPFSSEEIWKNRLDILLHATADEIGRALARVAAETERRLDPTQLDHLRQLVRYSSFPELHNGRLGGLIEKAIRWHHDIQRMRVEKMLEEFDLPPELRRLDALVPPPPFWMPIDPRIRQLETVGSILEEGREMKHCVGSLVGRAARGRSFFFHVDFEGEKATVELDPQGRVVQAAGPRNSDNRAVHWGSRELEECARTPKRQKQKVERIGRGDAFDRLRRRLGRFEWLDIAERLHRRAAREK